VTVMIIDGRPVVGTRSFVVVNPATGTVFAQAPHCSDEQLNESVAAAARAFPAWSKNVESRRAALVTAADLLQRRAGEIVALLTAEQGKPLAMARAELDGSVAALRSLAQAALPRQVIRDDVEARVEVVGRPLGVVAAITPWNFPVIIAANKLAPALLTGNTVVLKPAAAHDLKRITLELGGNDATILLDDVDLDAATEPLFWASFINTGQVCAALKRVYAPSDRYDEERAAAIGARLTCGIGVEGSRWGLEAFIGWHTVYTACAGAPVTELSETVP
jgi:acyl-CoA reductase-like NAD-dependent aldehyde dehydrogenase